MAESVLCSTDSYLRLLIVGSLLNFLKAVFHWFIAFLHSLSNHDLFFFLEKTFLGVYFSDIITLVYKNKFLV